MRARIHYHRGADYIVWLDSHGDALPPPDMRRAWRTAVYRIPRLLSRREA